MRRPRRRSRSNGAIERRSGSPHHQRVVYSRKVDVLAERSAIDAAVSGKTVCTIFSDAVRKWGDKPALRWKENGDWRTLTWSEYRDEVAAVTLALRSLGFGPGQFGLIMARNAPEHVIADLGIVHAGGAAISVYNTLAPEQIEYVANHSEASVAFVEDEVWLCPDPNALLQFLLEARPTLFVGVPRVWEKLMAGINAGVAAEPDENKRKMVQGAVSAAISSYRLRRDGQPVPPELAAAVEKAQPLFMLLRAKVGLDRCELPVTSTAPCRPELHEFWAALGLPLFEVWGMSELTGPATAVPQEAHQAPSIGRAIPGVEVKLGEDGELLVRGGNVMVGYYKEPGKTADIIDADGWVHSGDIGELGANGQFRIIDRKKELIITSSGKNISPANLEALAKSSPIIGQAVAVGDSRQFISVLVVLDPQVAPAWAKARGVDAASLAELAEDPVVVEEIRRALNVANTHLSRIEQFKRFTILGTEWTPESEELTPTMKLKRRVINTKYQPQIEAMYANPPGGHAVDPEREGG